MIGADEQRKLVDALRGTLCGLVMGGVRVDGHVGTGLIMVLPSKPSWGGARGTTASAKVYSVSKSRRVAGRRLKVVGRGSI